MTKTVMVVDDNENIRYSLKAVLEDLDKEISVITANGGLECLEKIREKKPSIILMDVMMPGLDGMDTVIKIKEDPDTKDIPVIFLTAKTDNLTKGMGSVCGEDFIEKPFEAEDLYNRIKKVIEK